MKKTGMIYIAVGLIFVIATIFFIGTYSQATAQYVSQKEVGNYQFATNFVGGRQAIYRLDTQEGVVDIYNIGDNFYDRIDFDGKLLYRISIKYKTK